MKPSLLMHAETEAESFGNTVFGGVKHIKRDLTNRHIENIFRSTAGRQKLKGNRVFRRDRIDRARFPLKI